MNKFLFSTIILSLVFLFAACSDDDDNQDEVDYQYHAHIHSPNSDNKHVNDTLDIVVQFESHSGEAVHHVNVKIHKLDDESTEILNIPSEAHVHEHDGNYTLSHKFPLTQKNGVEGHTDWVLEASVWGPDGDGKISETVGFHVHP